ncbi:hypothetical protein F5X68DRAFT_195387 [Plectosphaerella plurivora]|uniref:RING-type domain-containing protein n=1 Tax=Plectosphaerella plurivora TaxID=936078 RepID=A0A9P8V1H6_9PEZI|nr:hypothetical protein F5X68DRAFT_195387 [Plectosphaerella plurivora]
MYERDYEKNGACDPNPEIKKAIAYLDRNPEFQLESVPAKNFRPTVGPVGPSSVVEYWPDLKKQLFAQKALGAESRWDVSGMLCAVCNETLLFEGIIGPDGRPRPHVQREPCMKGSIAIVLPCGHIFCKMCLDTMREKWVEEEEDDMDPSHLGCPFCRASFQYGCGHFYKDLPAPETPEDLEAFPPTVPEGASLPPSCDKCLWDFLKRSWAESFDLGLRSTHADVLFLGQAREAKEMMGCFEPSEAQLKRLERLTDLERAGPAFVNVGEAAEDSHPTWCVRSKLARLL